MFIGDRRFARELRDSVRTALLAGTDETDQVRAAIAATLRALAEHQRRACCDADAGCQHTVCATNRQRSAWLDRLTDHVLDLTVDAPAASVPR